MSSSGAAAVMLVGRRCSSACCRHRALGPCAGGRTAPPPEDDVASMARPEREERAHNAVRSEHEVRTVLAVCPSAKVSRLTMSAATVCLSRSPGAAGRRRAPRPALLPAHQRDRGTADRGPSAAALPTTVMGPPYRQPSYSLLARAAIHLPVAVCCRSCWPGGGPLAPSRAARGRPVPPKRHTGQTRYDASPWPEVSVLVCLSY